VSEQEEEEEYEIYQPKDFEKLTLEQLEDGRKRGQESYSSIQSFLSSVDENISDKKLR